MRLVDDAKNKPPCDYFSVMPGMVLFLELKSTGCAGMPMLDVRPHQLVAMHRYDRAAPDIYAGFVIQFRSASDHPIYYLSGADLYQYAHDVCGGPHTESLRGHYLSNRCLHDHSILIPSFMPTPRARAPQLDIDHFLDTLKRPA